jgi:hypothetical protein
VALPVSSALSCRRCRIVSTVVIIIHSSDAACIVGIVVIILRLDVARIVSIVIIAVGVSMNIVFVVIY